MGNRYWQSWSTLSPSHSKFGLLEQEQNWGQQQQSQQRRLLRDDEDVRLWLSLVRGVRLYLLRRRLRVDEVLPGGDGLLLLLLLLLYICEYSDVSFRVVTVWLCSLRSGGSCMSARLGVVAAWCTIWLLSSPPPSIRLMAIGWLTGAAGRDKSAYST